MSDDTARSGPDERTRISGAQDERNAARPMAEDKLVLDRYRLERRVGSGGFGVVWSALDEKLEREVAVKVIPREDRGPADARVDREALAAARLNHPGIVALYELGSDEHDHYLVSELVHGTTLASLANEGAVSDRDVARIGQAVCEALAHAHARGVIHRDVKPANVMVVAEPAAGSGFAKLTDFGIAHLATVDGLTASGDMVGTMAYMAPEQAEGRAVSGASDVYSLGLTLYELWTGTNPVRGASPAATARRVGRPLPPLAARRSDLPPQLCAAIDSAVDPNPDSRPDPAELARLLEAVARELSEEGGLVELETLDRLSLTTSRTEPRRRRADQLRPTLVVLRRIGVRLYAGLATGVLLLVALETLGPTPPVSVGLLGAIAAAAVVVFPRAGWICAAGGLCVWLASPEGDRSGTALVLLLALAPIPALLPHAGRLWSAPALAPLLGLFAVAPLYVGLVSLASTAWRRAGLAAAGVLWLVVGELLTGRQLLFGVPEGARDLSAWQERAPDAVQDALWPLVSSPSLAPALVWMGFAVLLPLLLRGRFAVLDLALAAAWAIGLVFAERSLAELLGAAIELDRARGAVVGAMLGALIAVTVNLVSRPAPDEPGDAALP